VVSLITSLAVASATLDPCAMTCHARSDATSSTASSSAHCRAASTHAATTWQATAVCHHNHDAATLDATPQSRIDPPAKIVVVALAQAQSILAPELIAIGLDGSHLDPPDARSASSAFAVPLRL